MARGHLIETQPTTGELQDRVILMEQTVRDLTRRVQMLEWLDRTPWWSRLGKRVSRLWKVLTQRFIGP